MHSNIHALLLYVTAAASSWLCAIMVVIPSAGRRRRAESARARKILSHKKGASEKIAEKMMQGAHDRVVDTVVGLIRRYDGLDAVHIATIHRAFLSLTSQCLDYCETEPSLYSPALELARRAHEQLRLPFHLPLYQRLMETAASSASSSDVVGTVLEIVSFCQTLSPEAVQTAALFRPVITALITQGRFG